MSLLNAAAAAIGFAPPPPPTAIPTDVKTKIDRGRKVMLKDAPKRRLCTHFRKGRTYWYLTGENVLNQQGTATGPGPNGGKPDWRIRNRYDYLGPIIDEKVSIATARIPGFDVSPSTPDSERKGAAAMGNIALRYGYDKWRMRAASIKAVDLAIGHGGRSYAMPYFDPNVGPFTDVDGRMVGQGELKMLVLSANEVYWEPGVDFNESAWWAIERARPLDEVQQIPGFVAGGKDRLTADAATSDIPSDRKEQSNMVMVTEVFERPCPKYPNGRCMTFANARPIVDYRLVNPLAPNWWGDYPLQNTDGTVLDEPLLHELVYRHDPQNVGDDFGLTWMLIDFQRTAQDCWNKVLEFKNRRLLPQMVAAVGSILTPRSDQPGGIVYYKPQQNVPPPTWEPVTSEWLAPLMEIMQAAVQGMRDISSADDFNADPRVAAAAIDAVASQNTAKSQSFYGDLAEWWSRIGRHCLLLVARHYTEPRLLKIRGRWGQPQVLNDFQGAQLMGEVDVTVSEDSLKPRSRQQVMQELAWIQANFPGYLSPEVAIAALHSGTAEDLIRSYDLDMGRVNDVIRAIVEGSVLDMPDVIQMVPGPPTMGPPDPATGQPTQVPGMPVPTPVPSFMPTDNDSVPIWKHMFGDWMKTQEFLALVPPMQMVANEIWTSLLERESAHAVRQQQLQQAQAQGLGMANAAAPQTKGMPSQPGDGVSPAPQTGAVG